MTKRLDFTRFELLKSLFTEKTLEEIPVSGRTSINHSSIKFRSPTCSDTSQTMKLTSVVFINRYSTLAQVYRVVTKQSHIIVQCEFKMLRLQFKIPLARLK